MKFGRVAICISGLPRVAGPAAGCFQKYFSDLDADVFIHTWSTGCNEEIIKLYKPKLHIVQDPIKSVNMGSFGNMLYSIMQSNRLKRKYELENNFRYDLVIKTRFDVIFPNHLKFDMDELVPRTIYSSRGNNGINRTDYENHGISDVFYWGDSQSMDIISDTFMYYWHSCLSTVELDRRELKYEIQDFFMSPGNLMVRQCVMNNILIVKERWKFDTIWREDVSHLDPVMEFEKINERYIHG